MNTPQTELDVYIEMSRLADLWIDGQIVARDYYEPVKALKALAAEFKKARAIVKAHQPDGGEAERMEYRHTARETYRVVEWDTGTVMREFRKLGVAKRWARGAGHNGKDDPILTGYPPIAFVANNKGECVYNPRFSKRIGDAAGGIINRYDSSYF